MDPCECIWNHELNMRRLLSILRQGQSYCTENECLEDLSPLSPQGVGAGNDFMTMFLIMALAVALFVLRPGSMRNQLNNKAANHSSDSDGAPPTPPPAIN